MRAAELKPPLKELYETFLAAGHSATANDIAELLAFIEQKRDTDIDLLVAEIRQKLDPALRKKLAAANHLRSLKGAAFDEAAFKRALDGLRNDALLDKNDILQIAKDYGTIRLVGKSRDSYLEALEKHFYWALYNRDADEMAKRATPW